MTRKDFVKNILLILPVLGTAKSIKGEDSAQKSDGKFGFVHIGQMPKGTRPGDFAIIDNKTGKAIKFHERDGFIDDGEYIRYYSIEYFDDRTGLIGGTFTAYDKYDRKRGIGKEICTRPFYEIRDFHAELFTRKLSINQELK